MSLLVCIIFCRGVAASSHCILRVSGAVRGVGVVQAARIASQQQQHPCCVAWLAQRELCCDPNSINMPSVDTGCC